MTIRPETPADHAAIHEVNRLAFGQEAEANLVDGLRAGGFVLLSLVAEVGGEIVGHVMFSRLPIITTTGVVEALSLAPMAVIPSQQRRGIGTVSNLLLSRFPKCCIMVQIAAQCITFRQIPFREVGP